MPIPGNIDKVHDKVHDKDRDKDRDKGRPLLVSDSLNAGLRPGPWPRHGHDV